MIDHFRVFCQHLLIKVVLVISSLLFLLNEPGFKQYFDVMANRRLRQFQNIIYFCTLTASPFFGDVLKNPQTVRIAQGFRNLLNLLPRKCHTD